jgi:coenzyme F420-reducing hydrogenase beta subunit
MGMANVELKEPGDCYRCGKTTTTVYYLKRYFEEGYPTVAEYQAYALCPNCMDKFREWIEGR